MLAVKFTVNVLSQILQDERSDKQSGKFSLFVFFFLMDFSPQILPLPRRERCFLCALIALAIALRWGDVFVHSYAPDQVFSVGVAQMGWGEMVRTVAGDTHPPFYFALLKVWYLLTPDTLAWAQGLSLLFAVGWLWVTFRLGRDLFSPAAGWVALVCSAFAPYQIFWMHAARNHQLMPLAVGLVILLSYHYLARPGRGLWLGLAGAWALAIQTNYMGLVFGLVWGVAFLVAEPAPWRVKLRLAATTLPGLVSLLPWLAVLARQVDHGPMNATFFQETVSPVYLYYHALFGTMDYYQPNQAGLIFVTLLLLFTLVAVAGHRAVGRRWSYWILLLAMPTVPILLAKRSGWTLAERHLLFCLPPFMAYWGASVVEAWRWLRTSPAFRFAAPLSSSQDSDAP